MASLPLRRPWRWKPGVHSSWLLALVAALCSLSGLTAECPSLCECKWKNGKESVLCINASLVAIPNKLDAGTQVLDLSENAISRVDNDAFLKADLLNLQKVYFAKCKIKTLGRYAFRKLKNLVELDLSYNNLPVIPSHVFDSISSLRELKLSGNPIQRVVNDAFINIPQLVRLELSDCRIGTLEVRAFKGLEQTLEWLKLDRNRLLDVKSQTFTSMQNLNGLELVGNPWNCTCSIRPMREWMLRQNIPYSVPPVCRHPPRLADKSWARLDLDEFACVPEITSSQPMATGVEGRNVTMSCQVGGIPQPSVRWLWRNRVIANLSGVPYSNGRKLYVVHVTGYTSNLTILTADIQDAGVYVCAAENKAGKVEASVTLAIHRRPPETTFSGRVLVASIVVAALFVLATCLVVLCMCSVRRRQTNGRWQAPNVARGRDDSYEKIEMNHKVVPVMNHTVTDGLSSANSLSPGRCGEVAVVGPMKQKRLGKYRGIPSTDIDCVDDDEEEGGYEDAMETPTPTTVVAGKEGKMWGDLRVSNDGGSGTHRHNEVSDLRLNAAVAETADLHIPRASTYLEHRNMKPSEGASFNEKNQFPMLNTHNPQLWNYESVGVSTISNNIRNDVSTVQHHVMRKQMVGNNGGSLYTSALPENQDKNYPDLLEISPYNLNGVSAPIGSSYVDSSFCTLPRRRQGIERGPGVRGSARYYRGSDSQSPLLPDSRYGSSGGEGSSGSASSIRRSSIDLYPSPYYSLTTVPKHVNISQRSSSSLNLASPATSLVETTGLRSRRNPSLPSSPIRDLPSATPLLNALASERVSSRTNEFVYPSSPSSTSTAPSTVPSSAANTYDYHAAQLERFLEEYRSLQEQLCKMKETCENIRQQDSVTPLTSGNMLQYGDPLLYGGTALTPSGSEDSNPKSILKKSNIAVTSASATSPISASGPLTGDAPPLTSTSGDYGVDLSPYWLPRNKLLRRFSGDEFFQS